MKRERRGNLSRPRYNGSHTPNSIPYSPRLAASLAALTLAVSCTPCTGSVTYTQPAGAPFRLAFCSALLSVILDVGGGSGVLEMSGLTSRSSISGFSSYSGVEYGDSDDAAVQSEDEMLGSLYDLRGPRRTRTGSGARAGGGMWRPLDRSSCWG